MQFSIEYDGSLVIDGEVFGIIRDKETTQYIVDCVNGREADNGAMHKLLLDLQGYFNAERGADRYYRDYDLKKRVNAVVEQLPQ